MIILSHSGKQHSYHVAKALHNLGYLKKFITSSYLRSSYLQKLVLKSSNQYFTRRFIEGLPVNKVNSNWRFELPEIILRQLTGKSPKTQAAVYQRDIIFDKYVGNHLKILLQSETSNQQPATVFWGFQGSSHTSLKKANKLGITSIVELATAHVTGAQKILGEEQKLLPEWADSIDNLVFPLHYEKRLKEEPHIANHVISASDFTTQTLLNDGILKNKIIKLPLGFDLNYITPKSYLSSNQQLPTPHSPLQTSNFKPPTPNLQLPTSNSQLNASSNTHQNIYNPSTTNNQLKTSNPKPETRNSKLKTQNSKLDTRNHPFRLLYCGTVTQRKGIHYILEAMKTFKKTDIELHIIGGIQGSGEEFRKYKDHYIYHPPVSQHEMFELYKYYDALILPSIFEGFGLVIVEAMAAGLPVIATPHTMGPDVIEDGKNGYLIPIRNIEAIKTSIEKMLNLTDEQYQTMSTYSRESVLKFTWSEYQHRLQNELISIL